MSTMINEVEPVVDPKAPTVFTVEQIASPTALRLVVSGFNPSHDTTVGRIKLLTAALITEMEALRDRPKKEIGTKEVPNVPNIEYNAGIARGARWAALAITDYENAAMWGVKSATAAL